MKLLELLQIKPTWKRSIKKFKPSDDLVKFVEELVYDTYWQGRADGYRDGLEARKHIKRILKETKVK